MLRASPLKREFGYMGLKLADPNSKLTVEEVKSFYSLGGHFKTGHRGSPQNRPTNGVRN